MKRCLKKVLRQARVPYQELFRTLKEIENVLNVVHCAIWYHLYNLKNVKNTHGGVLILVKLQASSRPLTDL